MTNTSSHFWLKGGAEQAIRNFERGGGYLISKVEKNGIVEFVMGHGPRIKSTYTPQGTQPRDFQSWRNYISNELLIEQLGVNIMFRYFKPPVATCEGRDNVRFRGLNVDPRGGVLGLSDTLKLCRREPVPNIFERLLLLLHI